MILVLAHLASNILEKAQPRAEYEFHEAQDFGPYWSDWINSMRQAEARGDLVRGWSMIFEPRIQHAAHRLTHFILAPQPGKPSTLGMGITDNRGNSSSLGLDLGFSASIAWVFARGWYNVVDAVDGQTFGSKFARLQKMASSDERFEHVFAKVARMPFHTPNPIIWRTVQQVAHVPGGTTHFLRGVIQRDGQLVLEDDDNKPVIAFDRPILPPHFLDVIDDQAGELAGSRALFAFRAIHIDRLAQARMKTGNHWQLLTEFMWTERSINPLHVHAPSSPARRAFLDMIKDDLSKAIDVMHHRLPPAGTPHPRLPRHLLAFSLALEPLETIMAQPVDPAMVADLASYNRDASYVLEDYSLEHMLSDDNELIWKHLYDDETDRASYVRFLCPHPIASARVDPLSNTMSLACESCRATATNEPFLHYVSSGWLMGTTHDVTLDADGTYHGVDGRIQHVGEETMRRIRALLDAYVEERVFVSAERYHRAHPNHGGDMGSSSFTHGRLMAPSPLIAMVDLYRLLVKIDPDLERSPGGLLTETW